VSKLTIFIRQFVKNKKKGYYFIAFTLIAFYCKAQDSEVPYSWIAGSWVGDGFGGVSEELWSEPSPDGTIMGSYRHLSADGKTNFYEFFLLDSAGLRLKHFHPDFKGWETKDEFLHFKMIECTENKIILKGLVYERISDSEMKIFLDMKTKDGPKTEVFTMRRR